jgi:predicted RNase H-like HicB family nuclease
VEYVIIIHRAEEGGYWCEVPVLEGCFAQGETVEELLGEARDAIASHIEALVESGQAVPEDADIMIATVKTRQVA